LYICCVGITNRHDKREDNAKKSFINSNTAPAGQSFEATSFASHRLGRRLCFAGV
jgi:hypothetical protein